MLRVLDDEFELPLSLTTFRTTVTLPVWRYRCVAVTPEPFVPSPKSHVYVAFDAVDVDALKKTSWLTPGFVGETVNRATVGVTTGKSEALNVTYVGGLCVSVTLFVVEMVPVRRSRAEKTTSDCGVGATPLVNVFEFVSARWRLNEPDWPDVTSPISFPFATTRMVFTVRFTTITGKSDSYRPVHPASALAMSALMTRTADLARISTSPLRLRELCGQLCHLCDVVVLGQFDRTVIGSL